MTDETERLYRSYVAAREQMISTLQSFYAAHKSRVNPSKTLRDVVLSANCEKIVNKPVKLAHKVTV